MDGGAGAAGGGQVEPAVARQLVFTLDTVKEHVSHVLDKPGATNRTEAVRYPLASR